MSAWTDRILQEFPADLSRFWIACDPDNLLLDERILHSLRERGFEVLPFEDSVVFRAEYEERYRAAWDRGEEGHSKALVLQLRGSDLNALPWDYVRMGRKVSLRLANLLPKLSYGLIRQIDADRLEALFLAHNKHAVQPLGEGGTKDFILTHVFRISPYLLSRPEDFWREVLRLHYRGDGLPALLAKHVEAILNDTPLGALPIAELLASKSFMVRSVQGAWAEFLSSYGIQEDEKEQRSHEASEAISVPFEHPDVMGIVGAMFIEGTLRPVAVHGSLAGLPEWAKVGLVQDPGAFGRLVAEGVATTAANLPTVDSSHRDWVEIACRYAEVISRFNRLSAGVAEPIKPQVRALQGDIDERLKEWLFRHFADLPSLPAAKGPVMLHHVPRYLAMRKSSGEERIALLVFDAMAIDQWIQIRDHMAAHAPQFTVDESGCFAWLPTLTSVSRQALFSGMKPREFAVSIETTSREASLWARFWQENGLRNSEVVYQKGLKRVEQLAELEDVISKPSTRVAGIVVDMIDEIIHGAMLGKRGVSGQIRTWCDTGFVETLILLLDKHGYQIYITADHGNVDAEGIGRLSQGVVPEMSGERVRTYRSETLASVSGEIDTFRFDVPGLPPDFLPLYANCRAAFVPKGDRIVAHGGASVEELIVPFIKIKSRERLNEFAVAANRV